MTRGEQSRATPHWGKVRLPAVSTRDQEKDPGEDEPEPVGDGNGAGGRMRGALEVNAVQGLVDVPCQTPKQILRTVPRAVIAERYQAG